MELMGSDTIMDFAQFARGGLVPLSILATFYLAAKGGKYLIDLIDPPREVGTKHRHLPPRSPDVK